MNPKASIIMAVYNEEKYVAAAIESILNQTFSDFELIIIDDGSSDKSSQVIASYKDSRIKIVTNKANLNQAGSRNIGIKLARAEYCAIMDADDIAFPERLEREMDFLGTNKDIAIVGSAYYKFNADDNSAMLSVKFSQDQQIKRHISLRLGSICVSHPTALIRRDALLGVGLYDSKAAPTEDKDLWIRLAHKGYKFANLNEPLLKKRKKFGEEFRNAGQKRELSRAYVYSVNSLAIRLLYQRYENLAMPPLPVENLSLNLKQAYGRLYFNLGCRLFYYRNLALAKEAFATALECFLPEDKKIEQHTLNLLSKCSNPGNKYHEANRN